MEARTISHPAIGFCGYLPGVSPFPPAVPGYQRPSTEYQPRRTFPGGPRSHCLHGAAPRGAGCSTGPGDPYPPQAAWPGLAQCREPGQPGPRPGLQPPALARRATPGAGKMETAAPPGHPDLSFPGPRGPGGGALTAAAPRPSRSPALGSSCSRLPAAASPGATLLSRTLRAPAAPAARAR